MDLHLHNQEISIILCLIMGILHALEPGHGKSALVTHLLTEKKSFLRPINLALTTALTHAASILFISILVHGLLHTAFEVKTQAMFRGLNLISGLILLGLGASIFFNIKKTKPNSHLQKLHHHQGCNCPAHRISSSTSENAKSWKTLGIGFAVGLVPCPSAVAALSTALTSQDLAKILTIISMFSLGIFIALTVVGLIIANYLNLFLKITNNRTHPLIASYIQIFVLVSTGLWHMSMT